MSATRKYHKVEGGRSTSKGPRPKQKIVAIGNGTVTLACAHVRPATGRERVGGERRCEECPTRTAKFSRGRNKGWAVDR